MNCVKSRLYRNPSLYVTKLSVMRKVFIRESACKKKRKIYVFACHRHVLFDLTANRKTDFTISKGTRWKPPQIIRFEIVCTSA